MSKSGEPQEPRRKKRLWLGGMAVLLGAAAASILIVNVTSSTKRPEQPAFLAAAYTSAFTRMSKAVNADNSVELNAKNQDAMAAAFRREVVARQAFDASLRKLVFPSSNQVTVQRVLATDASIEGIIQGLLATDTWSQYDTMVDTIKPADGAFAAANTALEKELHVALSPAI